ncbi:MAG: VTT domain-containing protein [Candidatus Paceibacterota bacterium]
MKAFKTKEIIGLAGLAVVFITTSYFSISYAPYLQQSLLLTRETGQIVYVMLAVLSVVVFPLASLPLMPIAVVLWGSVTTAWLSIAGWFLGAIISFWIARKYGRPVVQKLVNLDEVRRFERLIPRTNMFWTIVALRMSVPVDGLSYALGLFSTVPFPLYAVASFIGIIPFAFIFSYSVVFPIWAQVAVFLAAAGLIYGSMRYALKKKVQDITTITMYYWGGEKYGIKIKNTCQECDVNMNILNDMKIKELKDKNVRIEIKPWLTNFWTALLSGTWHAPIILVEGEVFSQGVVVNRQKLVKRLEDIINNN